MEARKRRSRAIKSTKEGGFEPIFRAPKPAVLRKDMRRVAFGGYSSWKSENRAGDDAHTNIGPRHPSKTAGVTTAIPNAGFLEKTATFPSPVILTH